VVKTNQRPLLFCSYFLELLFFTFLLFFSPPPATFFFLFLVMILGTLEEEEEEDAEPTEMSFESSSSMGSFRRPLPEESATATATALVAWALSPEWALIPKLEPCAVVAFFCVCSFPVALRVSISP
jgi:hypothetical protein